MNAFHGFFSSAIVNSHLNPPLTAPFSVCSVARESHQNGGWIIRELGLVCEVLLIFFLLPLSLLNMDISSGCYTSSNVHYVNRIRVRVSITSCKLIEKLF